MYLTVGDFANADNTNEIISIDASGINTTTNVLTVTRGALNTTPAPIPAGRLICCMVSICYCYND